MKTDSFKRWRKWGHVDPETLIMNVFNHLFGYTFLPRVANCKAASFNTSCFRSFSSRMRNNSLPLYLSFLSKLFISLCLSISIFVFSLCLSISIFVFSLCMCLTFSLWLLECYFFDLSLFLSFFFHTKICLWWISPHLSNPRYTIVKSPQQ